MVGCQLEERRHTRALSETEVHFSVFEAYLDLAGKFTGHIWMWPPKQWKHVYSCSWYSHRHKMEICWKNCTHEGIGRYRHQFKENPKNKHRNIEKGYLNVQMEAKWILLQCDRGSKWKATGLGIQYVNRWPTAPKDNLRLKTDDLECYPKGRSV